MNDLLSNLLKVLVIIILIFFILKYYISVIKLSRSQNAISKEIKKYSNKTYTKQELKNKKFNKYLSKIFPLYRIILGTSYFAIYSNFLFIYFAVKSLVKFNVASFFLYSSIYLIIIGAALLVNYFGGIKIRRFRKEIYDNATSEERALIPTSSYEDYFGKKSLVNLKTLDYTIAKSVIFMGCLSNVLELWSKSN